MQARPARGARLGAAVAAAVATLATSLAARAELPPTASVLGAEVARVRVAARREELAASEPVAWGTLASTNVAPGMRWIGFRARGEGAVEIPTCAGRKRVFLDDREVPTEPGPAVIDLPRDAGEHRIVLEVAVSGYEHRVACSGPPRLGTRGTATDGLLMMTFASPHAGGGRAVVYVPPGHDLRRAAVVLEGLHPWNGSLWTYAANEALLGAARAFDVVLLFPSGLGNSLYTAPAEDEALRALTALGQELAVDPDRVTLWGASMGGAGATTVGLHHPDRFAAIVSLFGDSRYDLTTYVRGILHDEAGAHLVNAFDVAENARNVPVWLIHGDDDHVSPPAESAIFARALGALGFDVTYDHVPGAGHEGRVVTAFAERIVSLAVRARRVVQPRRVSFWSVRPTDTEAYGIRLTRSEHVGDAFFDVERVGDTVHLRAATAIQALRLPRGAFGFAPGETPAVVVDDPPATHALVTWDALP